MKNEYEKIVNEKNNNKSTDEDSVNSTDFNNNASLSNTNNDSNLKTLSQSVSNQIFFGESLEIKKYDIGNLKNNNIHQLNNNSSKLNVSTPLDFKREVDNQNNNTRVNINSSKTYYGNTFQFWFNGDSPRIVIGPHCK